MRKARIYDARQLPAYLSPAQYAALMGVNLKTVQKMCRTGRLPAEKVGPRLWRIDKNAALEQGALDRTNKKPAGAANTDELTGAQPSISQPFALCSMPLDTSSAPMAVTIAAMYHRLARMVAFSFTCVSSCFVLNFW